MIAARYPAISRAWLLAGEGAMFLGGAEKGGAVPFFMVDVERYVADPTRHEPDGVVAIPTVDEADFGALYLGHAMGDAVPHGSIVVVRCVDMARLVPGGDYVVVGDGFGLLRRVRRRAGSDELRLMPVDTKNFDEVRVASSDVRALFRVVAVVISKTT